MRYSNFHTHTKYSDGVGTVRQNIESAISKNMSALGFSDHSFTACDTSYCMKLEDYSNYFKEIKDLKNEYSDRIQIYTGLEKDYYSDIDRSQFDYIIASEHYIVKNNICYPIDHTPEQQLHCIADVYGGSVLDFAKGYYELATEHAIKCKPDFMGHFDVINKFGLMPENDEKYIEIANEAVDEVIKHCKVFEVNTGPVRKGLRTYPHPYTPILEHIHSVGGEVILNSDCHIPEFLDFYFDEAIEILKKIGFKSVSVFNGRGFDKVEI